MSTYAQVAPNVDVDVVSVVGVLAQLTQKASVQVVPQDNNTIIRQVYCYLHAQKPYTDRVWICQE